MSSSICYCFSTRTNKFGLPFFSSIIQVFSTVRHGSYPLECLYYGYMNGDILIDSRLEEVFDHVRLHQLEGNLKPDILLVGRRTNVKVSQLFISGALTREEYLSQLVSFYQQNEQFMGLAMDYFFFSESTFLQDFDSEIVLGRDMIDSYIFHYGLTNERISVIDCSESRNTELYSLL